MDEFPWALYASALGTGLVFGYVIQRGGFCLTRAVSNVVLMRDATILRAYVLALLVAIVGVQILMATGIVDIPIRPLRPVSNILGGAFFGFGMILSGGCSGSTWYRVGEGAIGAWVVLLGFAIGATAARAGAPEHGKWHWPLTGATVGVMITAGWWASSFGDRPTGITFAANTGELLTYPMVGFPNRVTWGMLMALGVPVGAFVAAYGTGQFRWKLRPGWSLLKIFAGGLLMGGSALIAEGCNINQGLTNSATLALGSLLTFDSMGAGAWVALWALFLRKP